MNPLSKAPANNAPLPFREHPVTAILARLIFAAGVISRASIMRDTAQAHAVMADAVAELPYSV